MTSPGTPKASQAAITAVQEALGCYPDKCSDPACECHETARDECMEHDEPMTERGCPVAVAAADAAAPHNAAQALRSFAETRGVNVGDEDDDWWSGYRQAQRECLQDAVKAADETAAGR